MDTSTDQSTSNTWANRYTLIKIAACDGDGQLKTLSFVVCLLVLCLLYCVCQSAYLILIIQIKTDNLV